eukprot:scaffold15926_cov36-Cyclotella_meneghiniana.AAC.1
MLRRSHSPSSRRSQALLRGLLCINQAFTSPDPVTHRGSFESGTGVPPSLVCCVDPDLSSSDPPVHKATNVSVDPEVDCRVSPNRFKLFPVGAAYGQRHHPIRAPPYHANHSDISSACASSIRPDPSSLDGTFLDSNEVQIRETRRANKEDETDKSLRTYRDDTPFDHGRTLPDHAFVHASPTRTSTRPNPSVALLGSRQAGTMRLVYESKDHVEKSFRTYNGRFPSGYNGAESISCRSFNAPPSKPVNNASTSRQSRFNCDDCADDKILKTYHVAPISGPDSRDSRPTSRDGSESPQHSDDYGESTSFFGEGASGGSFGDGSDPSHDGRGIGKGCGRSRRGHHVRDGCGGFVGDGSSSSVGSGGFRPRAVPRDLSDIASSDIIVSKLMRSLLSH